MGELKEVADDFNQFFTSVGARTSEAFKSLQDLHNLTRPLAITQDNEISEVDKFVSIQCQEGDSEDCDFFTVKQSPGS